MVKIDESVCVEKVLCLSVEVSLEREAGAESGRLGDCRKYLVLTLKAMGNQRRF